MLQNLSKLSQLLHLPIALQIYFNDNCYGSMSEKWRDCILSQQLAAIASESSGRHGAYERISGSLSLSLSSLSSLARQPADLGKPLVGILHVQTAFCQIAFQPPPPPQANGRFVGTIFAKNQ